MKLKLLYATNKNALCLQITLDGIISTIDFWKQNISEVEMVLLQKELCRLFGEQMRDIRETSYERGWRDRSSKRRKSDLFATYHAVIDWERK